MAYYENSGQVNDEAISIAGGKTFQVIQLADSEGNIINPAAGELVFDGQVTIGSEVEISNNVGNPIPTISGLSIPAHDYIALSYTGTNLSGVQYRTGGASGTIVGTLTLAYSGSNLISVTKS